MEKKIIKIYGITDYNNNVRYVGKTSRNLELRLKEHIKDTKRIYKYYWLKKLNNNVEIFLIDEVLEEYSNYWEIFYIQLFKNWGFNLLNLTEGGDGGKGFKHSDEVKKIISEHSKKQVFTDERKLKISLSKLGKKCPKCGRKGHKHSEETKKKIGEKSKGRTWVMSEESKKKLSERQKGKIVSEEMKKKISNTLKGRKPSKELIDKSIVNRKIKALERGFFHSEESKMKIKKSNQGHVVTESTRKKISDSCTKHTFEIFQEILKLKSEGFNNKKISENLKIPLYSISYIIKKFKNIN
jgi:hypothetical protein